MVYKIFIDTNILIDLLDNQRPAHKEAVQIIDEAEAGNLNVFVCESVLNTTSYILRKDYIPTELVALLNYLLMFVVLIPVTTEIYSAGIQTATNNIEDAILYSAALHAKLNFYITNDIKDFKKLERPALPIIKPADFLKLHI